MADDPVRLLLVHGTIVLSFGVLTGLPFWLAILRQRGAERIHGWRVAHATLIVNGLLLLLVALMGPHLDLSEALSALAAWALVASAYGFVFALGGGAWFGERGAESPPAGRQHPLFRRPRCRGDRSDRRSGSGSEWLAAVRELRPPRVQVDPFTKAPDGPDAGSCWGWAFLGSEPGEVSRAFPPDLIVQSA